MALETYRPIFCPKGNSKPKLADTVAVRVVKHIRDQKSKLDAGAVCTVLANFVREGHKRFLLTEVNAVLPYVTNATKVHEDLKDMDGDGVEAYNARYGATLPLEGFNPSNLSTSDIVGLWWFLESLPVKEVEESDGDDKEIVSPVEKVDPKIDGDIERLSNDLETAEKAFNLALGLLQVADMVPSSVVDMATFMAYAETKIETATGTDS